MGQFRRQSRSGKTIVGVGGEGEAGGPDPKVDDLRGGTSEGLVDVESRTRGGGWRGAQNAKSHATPGAAAREGRDGAVPCRSAAASSVEGVEKSEKRRLYGCGYVELETGNSR